ncbi:DNA (cytosine-5)-methyltransferase 1, replication foci domain containing protein [Trema orientale]|uniref:DNA (Cytosine-5)-methyltransferase 1, replication foci domain containing protein n=1 Tax=Trema orientale TaxID=63057 RepID=A0A2P5CPK7_TREOI|nr:DNA (cytosine-5)-methyltransferase 1, replication foci domain containing protein [Trema orientale]
MATSDDEAEALLPLSVANYNFVDDKKIYNDVIARKFDLSNVKSEISLLSKENSWIKLQKPRKSFQGVIRSILIAVHCLHFVMRNPETSGKSLWEWITFLKASGTFYTSAQI